MKTRIALATALMVSFGLNSCGPGAETTQPPAPEPKEVVYQRGHQLYVQMQLDSAATVLKRAAEQDSTYLPPLADLAALNYDLGMREEGETNPRRLERLRISRSYFVKIEAGGMHESNVYERLCELSLALNDSKAFLKYARKNAELYPYDRQFYNLGLAYFESEDYTGVIKSQKEACEKFKQSFYVGGFYRQLGRAYAKIGRDQTAERTFAAGVLAIDVRLAELRKKGGDYKIGEGYRRLIDDKIGMLLALKKLHQTYKEPEKLELVERQLKEAGYAK